MKTIIQAAQAQRLLNARNGWLGQNRGILSKIAVDLDFTPSFVRQVFRGGRSKDGSVEAALAAAGAPGFVTAKQLQAARKAS